MGLNLHGISWGIYCIFYSSSRGLLHSSVPIKRPIDSNSFHFSGTFHGNNNNNIQSLKPQRTKQLQYTITSDCISAEIWPNITCLYPNVFQPTCFKMLMPFTVGGRTELRLPFVFQRFGGETLAIKALQGQNTGGFKRALCRYQSKKPHVLHIFVIAESK